MSKGDSQLQVAVTGPQGKRLREFGGKRFGAVRISFVAEAAGPYRLRILSMEKDTSSRPYQLTVEEARDSTARDEQDDLAVQSFVEAERLRGTWEEKSLRSAIEKYVEAAGRWKPAGFLPEAAEALETVGEIRFILGGYNQALDAYTSALMLRREAGDRKGEIQVLNHLGYVYVYTGDNQKAHDYSQQALAYAASLPAPWPDVERDHSLAQSQNNLGEVYYSYGKLKRAMTHFERSLSLSVKTQDRKSQALAHLNIGYTASDSGDLPNALRHYQQSLLLWQAIDERKGEALARTAIGGVYSFTGNKQLALEFHSQAMNLLRVIGDHQGEAVALNGMGQVYEDLNETQLALENYQAALRLNQELHNRAFEALTRYYLGRVYRTMGDHQQALAYYQQSISMSHEMEKSRLEGYGLIDTGIIYATLGKKQEALDQYGSVLKLYRRIGDRRGQAYALNNIGYLYDSAGETEKASGYYKKALPLCQAAGDRNLEAAALYNIARAARDSGHPDEAFSRIQASIKLIESLRFKVDNQDLRASYFASVYQHYGLYIDLLMQKHKQRPEEGFSTAALLVSEKARARSLLETLNAAHADIRQGVVPDLLEREQALRQLFDSKIEYRMRLLNGKHTKNETAQVDKEMHQLTAEYQENQARIREQSPRYALLTQPQQPSLEQIKAELRDNDTMLLEYALGDERSYLWAVTSDRIESYELPDRATLEEAARKLYELLTARQESDQMLTAGYEERLAAFDEQYWRQASALSRTLLGPVSAQLGNKRLLIVTDGALQYIPFEALPVPAPLPPVANPASFNNATRSDDEIPLVLTHEIINLPSASTLTALRQDKSESEATRKTIAVLADPVFEKDDPRVRTPNVLANSSKIDLAEVLMLRLSLRDFGEPGERPVLLPRLPFTLREANAIMAVAPPGEGMLATGFDASRMLAMSDQLREYQIVHFATHGIINSKHPERSGIILSLVNQHGDPENGFLQLRDIYNLNLPANLVVLSACNTGLGKDVKGEGIVGITRGFMYAGAKSVVASLWKVDDSATAELMSRFYMGMLRDGMSPSAALQAAKIAMWKQQRWHSPYYWAAFVLQGEYRENIKTGVQPRPVNDKIAFELTGMALLAFCLCAALWRVIKRRARSD
ncbi:MAG: CHAT domain-containing protein [Pyrinomonadaceae bacterium]